MQNILLVEDDVDMQELISDYLSNYDFNVKAFDKPNQALEYFQDHKDKFNLIVLDLMLPQMDGFDLCKRFRDITSLPIIISSARGELSDKILSFDLGADDYLSKPYNPRELVLRINSILRRETKELKNIGEFVIDENRMEIYLDDYLLDLTQVEYDILNLFFRNKDQIVSRQMISNNTNGIEYSTKDRTIDMHISNIRQKIGDDPKDSKYIKSVWGIGYKFIG